MGAYHQMGHDSWNLVGEKPLSNFQGIILSPVNDPKEAMEQKLKQLGARKNHLEVVFDPQFYEPRVARGHLASWSYFPDDIDTVSLGDLGWWEKRGKALASIANGLGANAICSPAIIPRAYTDDYYKWTVDCASRVKKFTAKNDLDLLVTSIVRLSDLANKGRPEAIAGILTSTDISRVYLVFSDELVPRVQRTDVDALAGAIKLIKLLEEADTKVLVAFSGLDAILWKAAGATSVASGKFFNLRRFVPGRFEEEGQEGGRVVPYWTDNRLVTWLREDDIRLLDRNKLIDRDAAVANPYSKKILEIIDSGSGDPWVKFAWRQYLYWLQETEESLSKDPDAARMMLRNADALWGVVNDSDIYLYDRQNSGNWIRPWLNAIRIGLSDK